MPSAAPAPAPQTSVVARGAAKCSPIAGYAPRRESSSKPTPPLMADGEPRKVSSLALARFMRLPRRTADTWQGGLLRAPVWIDGPDGTPYRPWAGAWVSLDTGVVNVKLADGDAADWRLALDALLELALKFAGTRPTAIEVADQGLGEQLARELGDRDLAVQVDRRLGSVRAMFARMSADIDREPPPAALDGRGVSAERMRAFAVAARDFHAAALWRVLSDEDLITVEAPAVAKGLRHVMVLGHAGQTFGLGFFGSPADLDRLHASPDPEALLGDGGRWTMLFGPPWETPFADLDLWEEHGLALAAPGAHPTAMWYGRAGRMRRPDARELGDIETILLALSRTTEAQIDSGRWTHEVDTHDGRRQITLAIPDLLGPLDAPADRTRHGMPDRRAMERLLVEVQRFAATQELADTEALNAAIKAKFTGPMDDVPSTASTPLERAQDLVYRAFDARGRRRILLARKALEVSPDCADAYVLLAEDSSDVETARDLYAQGLAAGERALGPAVFAEQAGRFWGDVRTRPYMRARFGLARCLADLGQHGDAIPHYRELLRLDAGDSLGVRYSLLGSLLRTGQDGDAESLLAQFDEPTGLWLYGGALAAFRREGDSPASRAKFRAAVRANRHVPAYLTGEAERPPVLPETYAVGSPEEAVISVADLGDVWAATPGALGWVATQVPSKKKRKRRR